MNSYGLLTLTLLGLGAGGQPHYRLLTLTLIHASDVIRFACDVMSYWLLTLTPALWAARFDHIT